MKNIILYATDIHAKDAIGNHCLGLYRLFIRQAFSVHIYASRYDKEISMLQPVEDIWNLDVSDSVLLFSYSIFDPNIEKLLGLNCQKICYFHGVTPPELLVDLDQETAHLCEQACLQLPLLNTVDHFVVNSNQSAKQLEAAGVNKKVDIIPPVFSDYELFEQVIHDQPTRHVHHRLLLVARVVPHKKVEIALEVLAQLNKETTEYQLMVVGALNNTDYYQRLLKFARRLDLLDAITFTDKLSTLDLYKAYSEASLLLSTSKHEGFCVPALESMYFGKPVFALSGTAMDDFLIPPCSVHRQLDDLVAAVKAYTADAPSLTNAQRLHKHSVEILQQADGVWGKILQRLDEAA